MTQEQYNRAVEINQDISTCKYRLGGIQAKLAQTKHKIEELVKEKNELEATSERINAEIENLKNEIEAL